MSRAKILHPVLGKNGSRMWKVAILLDLAQGVLDVLVNLDFRVPHAVKEVMPAPCARMKQAQNCSKEFKPAKRGRSTRTQRAEIVRAIPD